MKNKYLLIIIMALLVIVLLGGCDLFGFGSKLAPPDWIIGTWRDEYNLYTWVFTTDNAVYTVISLSIDFKEIAKEKDVNVTDESTASTYKLTLEESGVGVNYEFVKSTSTTLDYFVFAGFSIVLTKQ